MYIFRAVEPSDLKLISRHRRLMFKESGKSEEILQSATTSFEKWLNEHLKNKTYFGLMVECDGDVVAGIGLMVIDWPPHPLHPTVSGRGYILNLYVEVEHRGKGLAKKLMMDAEKEFARRGIEYAILHPTAMAKPIYENMGWNLTSEMAKKL